MNPATHLLHRASALATCSAALAAALFVTTPASAQASHTPDRKGGG